MKRSLAILTVSAVCGGGTVAATAYANAGDGSPDGDSGTTLPEGFGSASGAIIADGQDGETFTCSWPKGAPPPELDKLPAMPKITDLPELLYSERAVRDRDSGDVSYEITQLGKVTESDDGSLTVESADGTAWTWELTDDTSLWSKGKKAEPSSLETGDQVMVDGSRDGETRTADHITSPAPEIGMGMEFGPPEQLGKAIPDKLGKLLPDLKDCEQGQQNEGTGTAT